ncbi:MAG TPA: hypothetical protein VF573_23035, partial [Paraburkholderia sp.]
MKTGKFATDTAPGPHGSPHRQKSADEAPKPPRKALHKGSGTGRLTDCREHWPFAANRSILVRIGASGPLSVYNQSNFKGFEGGCMLDREGFRPNVGIILLNAHNEVFWGKRLR